MRRDPVAKLLDHREGVMTVWRVDWPSTMVKQGKSYYATTYPGSDRIYIETVVRRRKVSELVGRNIISLIREAIQRASI